MSDIDAPGPTEPVLVAIEPFRRKAASLWTFYWKMAWRPRQFAEEFLWAPTAASITRAVKHTLWLAGFWSAMVGLVASVGDIMGLPKASALSSFAVTFVTVTLVALQVIPMAGMLWLLTRRHSIWISQTLLFFVDAFNLFLASTFLIYSVIGAIGIPFQLFVYFFRFRSSVPVVDGEAFLVWFNSSSYWTWYLVLLFTMGTACFVTWGRIFLFAAPQMIASMIRASYWQGFWRLLLSIILPAIALEGLLLLLVAFIWIA